MALSKNQPFEFWQNHIVTYIEPTLGEYRIDAVDTVLVEKKRAEWKEMGQLAGRTVNKIMTTLDAIFEKQVKARTIRYNPLPPPTGWLMPLAVKLSTLRPLEQK